MAGELATIAGMDARVLGSGEGRGWAEVEKVREPGNLVPGKDCKKAERNLRFEQISINCQIQLGNFKSKIISSADLQILSL